MSTEQIKARTTDTSVTTSDILFECPACGKSLVVEDTAEGMIIDCPQCRTNVIVPPKSTKPAPSPMGMKEEPKPVEASKSAPVDVSPRKRIAVLANQLKEIQSQRTEVTGRMAARLNDVNRDLVMMARLETSEQQIISEWNQLLEKISGAPEPANSATPQPTVIGASVANSGRTRVSFGP
jgi:DNA-directed RNA polymerase subunit RPC12/RpoP